jgi:AraC-like DNA-binding protein
MYSNLTRIDYAALTEKVGYSIIAVSQVLAVSERTLRRVIHRVFNTTPNAYFRRVRMERAAALLATGHSLKEIAFTLHFRSLSHFCREFKRYHGTTARNYTRQTFTHAGGGAACALANSMGFASSPGNNCGLKPAA